MGKYADIWMRWLSRKHSESDNGQIVTNEKKPSLLGKDSGRNLALLALLGVLLLVISKGGEKPVTGKMQESVTETPPCATSEQPVVATELARLLSQIAGAGRVEVYITYDNGPQQVLAEETTMERVNDGEQGARQGSVRYSRKPVIIRDDTVRAERPVVLLQKQPQVRGVIVVAAGAADPQVRQQLTRAVETALGVAAHRVSVFTGNI